MDSSLDPPNYQLGQTGSRILLFLFFANPFYSSYSGCSNICAHIYTGAKKSFVDTINTITIVIIDYYHLCLSVCLSVSLSLSLSLSLSFTGSPSRGGDVALYFFDILWHKPTELSHSFLFCSCVCFNLLALSTVFHSTNSPNDSPLSHSVLPILFLPYWSFQLITSPWRSPSALI